MYQVNSGDRLTPAKLTFFRWLPDDAVYNPNEPWNAFSRFNDGTFLSLYVTYSPEGALAEFLRRNPELLEFQSNLKLRIYAIEITIVKEGLDLRNAVSQLSVGIGLDRLTSAELDESIRYHECQLLAQDAISNSFGCLSYPSAAANWSGAWNLVLFGGRNLTNWISNNFVEVPCPQLLASQVHIFSS